MGLLAALFSGALWVSETSLPDGRPRAINLRQEEAYWETLDAAGITTSTTFAPCSFPAPELRHGHLLCGLGVPDLAGGMGAWTLLRDDIATEATTETGGRLVPLVWRDKSRKPGEIGVCEPVMIQGPEDPLRFDGTPMEKPIVLNADPKTGVVHVTDGVETREIAKGAWSEPFDFLFRSSPWFRVRGQSRFKLVDIDQSLRVYLDPIGFHPGELPSGVRLSSPEDHAWNLWQETGPFETVGWACATNALKDGMIDDRTFLEDARRVWDEEERIALHELADLDKRVVTAIFTVPDRIQHMFMRYEWMDRDQSGRRVDPRMAQAIEEAYLRVDAFVGRVRRERMRKGDAILVVSDHGFAPWRRAVNLNSFLVREGLMTLDGPTATRSLREQVDQSSALGEIDWSRTQAYSIGLGHIYLNLEGREPRGIVKPSEVEPLIARITEALMKLRDGEAPVVAVASRGDRAMVGTAIPEGAAEIYVGFHRGYRVSWQSCLGGANEAIVSENVNAWSGDHCSVDPREVPGVLLTDLKLGEGAARVVDVGPTILDWAGLAPAAGDPADGHSLLAR